MVQKIKEVRVHQRLVLVQKRTRLEFLRREIGRLYTGELVNTNKGESTSTKEHESSEDKYHTKKATAIKKSRSKGKHS